MRNNQEVVGCGGWQEPWEATIKLKINIPDPALGERKTGELTTEE
jgi:hypothetical protein